MNFDRDQKTCILSGNFRKSHTTLIEYNAYKIKNWMIKIANTFSIRSNYMNSLLLLWISSKTIYEIDTRKMYIEKTNFFQNILIYF